VIVDPFAAGMSTPKGSIVDCRRGLGVRVFERVQQIVGRKFGEVAHQQRPIP
jgi:hypothetical protein